MTAKKPAQDREPVRRATVPESIVWCLQQYVEAYAEQFEVKEEVRHGRKILRVFRADREP